MATELTCPITMSLFVEPVTTRCGHTFEKSSLLQILTSNGTPLCPTCRAPLERTMPIVNYTLKALAEQARIACATVETVETVETTVHAIPLNPNRPRVSATRVNNTNTVHIKVLTDGNIDTAVPVDFYFLNDRSGSMSERAAKAKSVESADADVADANEFARHQLTDFAVNVCNIMDEKHRVGIVVFDTEADVVARPTIMNDAGKASIKQKLPLPAPRGGTNFWAGILKTLELVKQNYRPGALTVILLLTDGATDRTHIPAGGFRDAIADWKEDNPTIQFMINTIGFGYGPSVDMKTLADIAHSTGGTVSYIPDGGLVCPVFTHLIANLTSCQHVNLNLCLSPAVGIRFAQTNFDIKMLQAGQSRDFFVEMRGVTDDLFFKATIADTDFTFRELPLEDIGGEYCRDLLVKILETSLEARSLDMVAVRAMYSTRATDSLATAIEQDVQHDDLYKGQIEKAFRLENWSNWGYHYLLSILDGHRLQIRVNDKDAVGMLYAVGTCTERLIKSGTKLLRTLTLPEGKYSKNRVQPMTGYNGYQASQVLQAFPARAVTLAQGGGCFIGCGQVLMADGSRTRVDALKKGDLVHGGHRVVCVQKTIIDGGKTEIVRLDSGGWTPNHPVRYGKTWYLPGDIATERVETCDAVYNFVLESGHILTIGQVETCTLGHEFEDDVVAHPFYGKRRAGVPHIMDVLETSSGYQDGYVVMNYLNVRRDEQGYVCGFA